MSYGIVLVVALIVALLAWLIIPGKSRKSGSSAPIAGPLLDFRLAHNPQRPRQNADDEKLQVLQEALREKFARKHRNEVLAEAKDLIEQDE